MLLELLDLGAHSNQVCHVMEPLTSRTVLSLLPLKPPTHLSGCRLSRTYCHGDIPAEGWQAMCL